jgi:hypothetical protein
MISTGRKYDQLQRQVHSPNSVFERSAEPNSQHPAVHENLGANLIFYSIYSNPRS